MKKKLLLSLVTIATLSTIAWADPFYDNAPPAGYDEVPQTYSGPYIGLAFGLTDVSADLYYGYPNPGFDSTDIDYNSLMLQAGYEISPYMALEFRYWLSTGDGDYSHASGIVTPNSYKEFNAWGIYVKPMFPVTPEFSIYALLGFSGVQIDGEPQYGHLVDDTSFSGGFGAIYNFTPNIGLFVDYVYLYDDTYYDYYDYYSYYSDPTGTSVYTINFGLTYKF